MIRPNLERPRPCPCGCPSGLPAAVRPAAGLGALSIPTWAYAGAGLVAALLIWFALFSKTGKARRRRRAVASAAADYQRRLADIRRRFGGR